MDVSRAPLWLMKTEPAKYSYGDLARDGRTVWDGVRNNQAALYLKAMKIGDLAFIYHSVTELAVVGVARIVREAYIDPSDAAARFVAVDIAPDLTLVKPVPLASLKGHPALAGMAMFRQFRLSVSPVTEAEAKVILEMGGA
jgi:predicted RNA-binding protein with PUA-like domain